MSAEDTAENTIDALLDAVQRGDQPQVRLLLRAHPALINTDTSENNEHRAIHHAVLRRDAPMTKLLMEAGADARKGIYPHRDATSALTLARERGYSEIVAIIEDEERARREELSCPNASISPVQDDIVRAIRNGDNAQAIRLLNADKTLIQACDRHGATPLHAAAAAANQEMLAWLLTRRAKTDKEDLNGLTPLDHAALYADPCEPVAQLLLAAGARITIRAAIALENEAQVRNMLAEKPALLQEIDSHGGLLTLAVNHGSADMVRLLLDLGADVDERIALNSVLNDVEAPVQSWGMPLWHAARNDNFEICQLLLDRGADPNANVYASGWPLRNAWHHPDGRVKRLLLDRGARMQPYMVAETHDVEQARALLADNPTAETINELVWESAESGCPQILELALPLVPWPPDDKRWHWVMIQPPRGINADGEQYEGHFRTMRLLLESGIDPNVSRYGQTVLHFLAAYSGGASDTERARFAALLIDHGARTDLRDDLLKSTPLAWAIRWNRPELAKTLMAKGASFDEPDAEPWATPRAWAEKSAAYRGTNRGKS